MEDQPFTLRLGGDIKRRQRFSHFPLDDPSIHLPRIPKTVFSFSAAALSSTKISHDSIQ